MRILHMKVLWPVLVFVTVFGVISPQSAFAQLIYWTDSDGSISRSNLDGSNAETLITGLIATASMFPTSIALDEAGGKMYWAAFSSSSNGRIQRANLDGSDIRAHVQRRNEIR